MAAGRGSRFGAAKNKVFADLGGQSVLSHTLEVFERHLKIHDIFIVHHADDLDVLKTMTPSFKKVRGYIQGGNQRYDSVHRGLEHLKSAYTPEELSNLNVHVHDGARPFVTDKIIDGVIQALERGQAATVAVPVTDTLYRVDESLQIKDIPSRAEYYRAQTPQSFNFKVITEAYERADFSANPTDDCMVVRQVFPDVRIDTIQGDSTNMKVTFEDDQLIALQILKKRAARVS